MSSRPSPTRERSSHTCSSVPSSPTKRRRPNHAHDPVSKLSHEVRQGGVNQTEEMERNNEFLFFGDSLTYGMSHATADRYFVTWPNLLKERLTVASSSKYTIVESALCSRTTKFDDDNYDNKSWLPTMTPHIFNGKTALAPILLSHSPRWMVLLLGTNDLKKSNLEKYSKEAVEQENMKEASKRCTRSRNKNDGKKKPTMKTVEAQRSYYTIACDVAQSCCDLGKMAQSFHPNVNVLIVTPPPIRLTEDNQTWGFSEKSVEIAKHFPKAFRSICKKNNLLNVSCPKGSIDMESSEDGIHITESHNAVYADVVWEALHKSDNDLQ